MSNEVNKLLKDIREHIGLNITADLVGEHLVCGVMWYRIDLTDNKNGYDRRFDVCRDILLDEQNIEEIAIYMAQNAIDYFNAKYRLQTALDYFNDKYGFLNKEDK